MSINNNDIRNFRSELRKLEREIEKSLKNETVCCGLTLSQCHTLLELSKANEVSIKDLSEILDLDKSTLSRVVDGLVTIGLINREINPDDRRYMIISLSENGKKVSDSINNQCDDYYLEIFKNLPDEKHENIMNSISLLSKAMKKVRNEN